MGTHVMTVDLMAALRGVLCLNEISGQQPQALLSPGGIWQRLETFLVVTPAARCCWFLSSRKQGS